MLKQERDTNPSISTGLLENPEKKWEKNRNLETVSPQYLYYLLFIYSLAGFTS